MNELLKINYEAEQPTVSARDLHEALGVASRFSRWFDSNKELFVEGEDYNKCTSSTVVNNGARRELEDYSMSVLMAKHICLMSRTEKGKRCRDYLIDLEKAWNTPEQIMARALKMANRSIESLKGRCKFLGEQVVEQQQIITELQPKPCVIYGNKAEEPIRELFQADHPEYKVDYHEFRILQSKKYPFMQASLDGELTDQDGRKGILEIKTSSINQSMQYAKWKDQIPDNYYAQILHYLLVTGWDFVVLRARLRCDWWDDVARERDYRIDRCNVEADLEYLLEAEMRFWKCVENRKMPGCILPEI